MRVIVRFLAWMAVVAALGVQATGLGTLGLTVCVERSGGSYAIEAFGQRCCAEGGSDRSVDERLPGETCDDCCDRPLALPVAMVMPTVHGDGLLAEAVPSTKAEWMFPVPEVGAAPPVVRSRSSRPPALTDSVLVAETIVLRI